MCDVCVGVTSSSSIIIRDRNGIAQLHARIKISQSFMGYFVLWSLDSVDLLKKEIKYVMHRFSFRKLLHLLICHVSLQYLNHTLSFRHCKYVCIHIYEVARGFCVCVCVYFSPTPPFAHRYTVRAGDKIL